MVRGAGVRAPVTTPRASPACHASVNTAAASASNTTSVVTRDRLDRNARVPLDSPANANPTSSSRSVATRALQAVRP
jgi:hypothetical protein